MLNAIFIRFSAINSLFGIKLLFPRQPLGGGIPGC